MPPTDQDDLSMRLELEFPSQLLVLFVVEGKVERRPSALLAVQVRRGRWLLFESAAAIKNLAGRLGIHGEVLKYRGMLPPVAGRRGQLTPLAGFSACRMIKIVEFLSASLPRTPALPAWHGTAGPRVRRQLRRPIRLRNGRYFSCRIRIAEAIGKCKGN